MHTQSVSFQKSSFEGSPFPINLLIRRWVWMLVQSTVFKFSPRPVHFWRCFLLRLFGATVGKGVHPYPNARFWAPWNLEIGDDVGIADGAYIYSMAKVCIGAKTAISEEAFICTGTHDYTHPGFPLVTAPIVIGADCWIAVRAFVHPGVVLPDGVVVGAYSVVTKSLPAWSVCAGNPCKFIKPRK